MSNELCANCGKYMNPGRSGYCKKCGLPWNEKVDREQFMKDRATGAVVLASILSGGLKDEDRNTGTEQKNNPDVP